MIKNLISKTNINKKIKPVLVSGIQSSGRLHIGNYFGAIKQMVDLVNAGKYESYIFVADYHSMTSLFDKEARLKNTFEAVATYLACGMDKKKVHIFKQSDVVAHTELAWILNTVTPVPMLFLAHAFKDKSQQNEENMKDVNAGLFDYPVLMAADILIYNADLVPVGKDQEQHIEMTREIAGKYNRAYKVDTFKMPKAFIQKEVETVPGIDGTKMSKSKGNDIPLFVSKDFTAEEIKKKIMSIKTDSARPEEKKNPDENNIYKIHKLFLNEGDDKALRARFENANETNPYSYKEAKEELFLSFTKYFKDMNERYEYFTGAEKGRKEVMSVMKSGAKNANLKADTLIKKVKKETGLDF